MQAKLSFDTGAHQTSWKAWKEIVSTVLSAEEPATPPITLDLVKVVTVPGGEVSGI